MLSMLMSLDMSVLRMRIVILIAIIAASIESVFADIAPDPLSGGKNLVVKGREKTSVAMIDEVVKLKLSKDVCQVDVVFTMKNTSSTYETMQVGFPHDYAGELRDFNASVQGKPVKFKSVKETSPDKSPDGFPTERTTHWELWETTFPPGQPIKIAVSYWNKPSNRATWTVGSSPIAYRLKELSTKEGLQVPEHLLSSRSVEYILRTGGHWSGPIGRCQIEVTFNRLTSDHLTVGEPRFFEPTRAQITRDKINWDLKDYEPERDVYLSFTPDITRTETCELLKGFHKAHPYSPDLTEMLAEYLIVADRKKEANQIVLDLLKHWQDRIVIWGPGSEDTESLRHSVEVFSLIRRSTHPDLRRIEFDRPSEYVPVIESIAKRVKRQMENAAPNKVVQEDHYRLAIEKLLEWCRTHSKVE